MSHPSLRPLRERSALPQSLDMLSLVHHLLLAEHTPTIPAF